MSGYRWCFRIGMGIKDIIEDDLWKVIHRPLLDEKRGYFLSGEQFVGF